MKRNYRLAILLIFFFLLGGGVISRLFFLQILHYDHYSALAQDQQQLYQTLFPRRGEIFMQDISVARRGGDKYYPLAINKEFKQVYIVPKDITGDKEELAGQLAELLGMDREVILQRMNKPDDPYEPLKNKVSEEVAKQVEGIDGVGLLPETWRYYPNNSLASHLVGFVGGNGSGQYGLESYYEEELRGKSGFLTGGKDTAGYWIPALDQELESAVDGSDLILTIDQNIQFKAEKELEYLIDKWQAESGTIIIMEPSGAIRAMASWPGYNPNEYNLVEDIDVFLNPAVQKVYEPGSIFKPLTMAGGLEYGAVNPLTKYTDVGEVHFGGSVIKNVDQKVYGEQTMTQVLEKSLNTGVVFVEQELGEDSFVEFMERFKFNQPTGIDTSGEVNGNIFNLYTGREINLATISFGQGITVTPIGMISAIGAIANEGKMMRPFLVEKIGEREVKPQVVGQVMTPLTAEKLTKMLVSVTDNGYGRPARVAGYSIASKTGTAQIAEAGGYSEDSTIHSFVGFAPAFNSQFVILIKIDKPVGINFASDSIGPSFANLAKYLFHYLEIPPQ